MTAVVDTSALVHLFTGDELDPELATRLAAIRPVVPDVVDVEFLHALRGLLLGGKIRADRAEQARRLFEGTPAWRIPTQLLGARIWSLRDNFTAYDAAFIALAETLRLPLLTCDGKQDSDLHRAAVEVY